MIRILAILLWSVLLSACAIQPSSQTPAQSNWFNLQYGTTSSIVDLFNECGPTVGRNTVCWQVGICRPRGYARSRRPLPLWWELWMINTYINSEGGQAQMRNYSLADVRKQAESSALIFHVNHTHFVTAFISGNTVKRYDTLSGVSTLPLKEFIRTISFGKYLVVPRR